MKSWQRRKRREPRHLDRLHDPFDPAFLVAAFRVVVLIFFPGLHQPSDGKHFPRACISVNRLQKRVKPIGCDLFVDSGAFMELLLHGRYRHTVDQYAAQLIRIHQTNPILIAVAQDYMCEPFMLKRTGMTIEEHQRLTIERYDALIALDLPFPIMPVLQGFEPRDYARHVEQYGDRLRSGAWVGVGSVCKRNTQPETIVRVLAAIHHARPDLRLHGFGVKLTALLHPGVAAQLYSADSMAWSYSARKQGRSANDYREALAFVERIEQTRHMKAEPWQIPLPL